MTIKQQGGVFGRNPSFNDVDMNTLDVTGQVTSGGLNVDAGTLFVDPVNNFVGIGTPAPGDRLTVNGNVYLGATSRTVYTAGSANLRLQTGTGNTIIYRDNAATEVASFTSTGLAFPNGKGIDFSATSGTGTSELFNDYEEGTWTPTFTAAWTTAPTVTSAQYTKVGRQVTVTMLATNGVVTAGGGIGGLPFASNSTQGAGAYGGNSDTTESMQGTVGQSASSITNIPARTLTGDTWQITATYFT